MNEKLVGRVAALTAKTHLDYCRKCSTLWDALIHVGFTRRQRIQRDHRRLGRPGTLTRFLA